jgi:4-carboxymuconolactone decarboxylase
MPAARAGGCPSRNAFDNDAHASVSSIPGRLAPLRANDLDAAQQAVWDAVTKGRRASAHAGSGGLVGADGALVGPFNAMLYSPEIGEPAAKLGEAIRFSSSLDRRTLELVTVVVAIKWRAAFEYWAHRRYAIEAGVPEALVDELARGGDVASANPEDRRLIESTRELLDTGRLSDEHYQALEQQLGERGAVDLVVTVGYYCLISFVLNAFEVPAPKPSEELWPNNG